MIQQMTRRSYMDVMLQESNELAAILEPANGVDLGTSKAATRLTPKEEATFLATTPQLRQDEYVALLNYLQQTGHPYYANNYLPHPPNTCILLPYALHPAQVSLGEYTYSCFSSHEGNSAIQFYNHQTHTSDTGFIHQIWQLPLEGIIETFIIVQPHEALTPLKEQSAPFIQYPKFMTRIVKAPPSNTTLIIIEPTEIITHLTTLRRPAGTYGINEATLVVCWSLNRGRHK